MDETTICCNFALNPKSGQKYLQNALKMDNHVSKKVTLTSLLRIMVKNGLNHSHSLFLLNSKLFSFYGL